MVVDASTAKIKKANADAQSAAKKNENGKQLSISSFFMKKSTDSETPRRSPDSSSEIPESRDPAHHKNLKQCFEEVNDDKSNSRSGSTLSASKGGSDQPGETKGTGNETEEDCLVIGESTPSSKTQIKSKTANTIQSKNVELAKTKQHFGGSSSNRESKDKKQNASVTTLQNTLCFSVESESNKAAPKQKAIRAAHPEGKSLKSHSDTLMIAEFCSKFRYRTSH